MFKVFPLVKAIYQDYRGNSEQALRLYSRSNFKNPWMAYRLGVLYSQKKQWKEAEKFLKLALGGLRDKSTCLYRIGVSLERQGNKQEAASYFRQAITLRPGWLPWVEHFLSCSLMNGEDDFTQDELVLLGSKASEAWHGIALQRIKNGKSYQAIPALEKALKLSPKEGSWWFELGTCFYKLGRTEEAETAYLKSRDCGVRTSDLFYYLGMVQEKLEKVEAAKASFAVACKLKKVDPEYGSGLLHKAYGNFLKGAEAFREYIKNNPEADAMAHYYYGMALDYCCEWENAAEQMELAICLSGTEKKDWYLRLGILYERCGQIKEASEVYRQILKTEQNHDACFRLASCLEKMGDWEGASKVLRGSRYYKLKTFSNISVLKKRLAESNFNPYIAWQLGSVLEEKGSYRDACLAFRWMKRAPLIQPFGIKTKELGKAALYLDYCENLPIDEHCIFYESFLGNTMSCSPYAIFKKIYSSGEHRDLLHVWAVNDMANVSPEFREAENVVFVSRGSDAYLRHLATAKYLVNNVSLPYYFIRREKQIYCNTWHGTPLKSLGDLNKFGPFDYGNVSRNFLQANLLIHPNQYTEDILLDKYHVRSILPGQSIVTGYPRQDLMLNVSNEDRQKLRSMLVGEDDRPIMLYAPTWRDNQSLEEQEKRITDTLSILSKTGYRVLFKAHQFLEKKLRGQGFSAPPSWLDTNELLSIVDVLITDYSSIGIDFLATGRPVLYYVDDWEDYASTRGLCLSMDEFPGIVCRSKDELKELLSRPLPAMKLQAWQKDLVAFDDGHATERVVEHLFHPKKKTVEKEKPSILFYPGQLLRNGIGTAFVGLIDAIADDVDVYLSTDQSVLTEQEKLNLIEGLLPKIHVLPRTGSLVLSAEEEFYIKKWNLYKKFANENQKKVVLRAYRRECRRLFGDSKFTAAVNYEGYNSTYTTLFAAMEEHAEKKVIYLHNNMFSEYTTRFEYLSRIFGLYNSYDRVVSVSKATSDINRETLSSLFDIDSSKFGHIDNLINAEKILNLSQEKLITEEEDFYRGSPFFINMARLSSEKDHKKLITAFSKVVQDFPDARLFILGDGYLRIELLDLISELNLKRHVFLVGKKENPYPYLAKADCFVMSSNHEGQPMVLLEAMILGRSIISTDIPAARGLLNNTSAKLVKNDADSLAQGLKEACVKMPEPAIFDLKKYNENALNEFYHTVGL